MKEELQAIEASLVDAQTLVTDALTTTRVLIDADDDPAPDPFPILPPGKPVALCVGHSRYHDKGAASVDGTFEWNYNLNVALATANRLDAMGIPAVVVDEYPCAGYTDAMNWLAAHLRDLDAVLALELHFNAADGSASQEEYLYWHASKKGERLAQSLLDNHTLLDPNRKTRGIKPKSSGNGSQFLSKTHCPAVICEPFFGDDNSDWSFWGNRKGQDLLADIYTGGIVDFLK